MDYWSNELLHQASLAAVMSINPPLHESMNPFFPSLWCSLANMPASHAGDHRSEAGQGRQPQTGVAESWSVGVLDGRIIALQFMAATPPINPPIHQSINPFLPGAWFTG